MKLSLARSRHVSGIALVVVMVTIFVLTALVAAFSLSMKTEMKLARNASSEAELEWIARSGVEAWKWELAAQLNFTQMPYDSLNQKWAGGPGNTVPYTATTASTAPAASGQLGADTGGIGHFYLNKWYPLGTGKWQCTSIEDGERKFNINAIANSPDLLNQAFINMGVDAGEYPQIVAAIQDWVDTDDDEHIGGAESGYYQSLTPPYLAKNGPIDDLNEMLMIKGITPAMFWGAGSSNVPPPVVDPRANPFMNSTLTNSIGLVDLVTPLSSGYLNLNTVSPEILKLFPGFDDNIANSIIQQRAGPDGIDGNEDDTPFGGQGGTPQRAIEIATGSSAAANRIGRFFRPRSIIFKITIQAQINNVSETYIAVVARNSAQDIQTLSFRKQ